MVKQDLVLQSATGFQPILSQSIPKAYKSSVGVFSREGMGWHLRSQENSVQCIDTLIGARERSEALLEIWCRNI
jgi:hypothetical protein